MLDPDLADAWASRGLLEQRRYEIEASRDSLLRAIELNPNHAMAHFWLSEPYIAVGDHLKAMKALEKAHRIDPLHPTITYFRALNLTSFYRLGEADALADEMIQMHPNNTLAMGMKGYIALRRGQRDVAVRWLRKAYDINWL